MKAFIAAGAAGVHFEDQLASEKKCGHLGGKVLIPTAGAYPQPDCARLAADVMGTPTGHRPHRRGSRKAADLGHRRARPPFVDHAAGRTAEGFFRQERHRTLHRARLAYAPTRPDLVRDFEAGSGAGKAASPRRSAQASQTSCWPTIARPSFNWKKNLDDATIARFQRELGAMGYKFQFITLAGFHQLNYGMFELARGYKARQMAAYCELQQAEFAAEANGYTATATSARSAPAISIAHQPAQHFWTKNAPAKNTPSIAARSRSPNARRHRPSSTRRGSSTRPSRPR
jgi:isocitrate lyase